MKASAKYLTQQEITECRQKDSLIWQGRNPSYMNLIDRLICDVTEDSIPEPDKGKILLLIRQVGRKLSVYNNHILLFVLIVCGY